MIRTVLAFLIAVSAAPAWAHSVTVDGSPSEWLARGPLYDNEGMVARGPGGAGEWIFNDASGDQRTDLGAGTGQDLRVVRITGDATSLYALILPSAAGAEVPQFQLSLDFDRISGSGQAFLAGFSDTTVADAARWEFLIQTRFGGAGGVRVLDPVFAEVGTGTAARDPANGYVELAVPWAAFGLSGPPTSAVRITVSSYVSLNSSDDTTDILGPTVSNAIDAIGDCGDPRSTAYPNAWDCDLNDGRIDWYADVWFTATGEVRAPLQITRFLSAASTGNTEWVAITNVTAEPQPTLGLKLGDDETPDAAPLEWMGLLPPGDVIAPQASYVVAVSGSAYQTRYLRLPDAEITATSPAPDLTLFNLWVNTGSNAFALANAGDSVVLLDASNVIIDLVNYGSATYPGIVAMPAPVTDRVAVRKTPTGDTDDNLVDFSTATTCTSPNVCPTYPCATCEIGACGVPPAGTSCADTDACNGSELCDAAGICQTGTPLNCDDSNPCTDETCNPASGCSSAASPLGASCSDGNACNGGETCDGAGSCQAASPLNCDDGNPCTADSCDATTGCAHAPVAAGTGCGDGNACNGAETCDATGTCQAGTPPSCNDANPCTDDACDPVAGCVQANAQAGTDCSDADVCNGAEACDGQGACQPGTALSCDDANPCTDDSCSASTGCVNAIATPGTACSDANACNGDETCDVAGTCQAGTAPNCDDANPCTANSCDLVTGCATMNVPAGTGCSDGNACNGAETCDASGTCQAATAPSCDDGNPCTADSCDAVTGCAHVPVGAGTACSDGNACNGAETCDAAGACQAGTALSCDDANPCTTDSCDPTSGCATANVTDGTSCSDGVVCNGAETCSAGTCVAGTPPASCGADGGVDAGPDGDGPPQGCGCGTGGGGAIGLAGLLAMLRRRRRA